MANEYLKRTPTSTGNKRVFTWSGWVKQSTNSSTFLFTASPVKDNNTQIRLLSNGQIDFFDRQGSDPTTERVLWNPIFRDYSSWMHILINADTTKGTASDRVKCYVNGIELSRNAAGTLLNNSAAVDTPPQNQNFWRLNGSGYVHYIGANLDNTLDSPNKNQFADVFYIDGQQLGPEVFGFYKDGNGYISAGSTQSTDFRNGQWVPRTPREIKNLINDNGGFGVNGFYLPMNDSSNFGADFHTTPNSIITLKGEDLPQPRNGAPETTDAYVSQLRTDPYAANLVLAVPGISTATGPNLVTNGTFDTNTNNWTANGSTLPTLSVDTNRLKLTHNGANGGAYQNITTVVGETYVISADLTNGDASSIRLRAYGDGSTGDGFQGTNWIGTSVSSTTTDRQNLAIVAETTTTRIYIEILGTNAEYAFADNVVVRQEDAPRDYSADIKGSGTNKTLTAGGNAGVGYGIPGYYGSALNFNGTGDDGIFVPASADIDLTGDFTIEYWAYLDANVTYSTQLSSKNYYNSSNLQNGNFYLGQVHNGTLLIYSYDGQSSGVSLSYTIPEASRFNQWQHMCFEREGNTLRIYLNGVVVAIDTSWTRSLDDASNGLYIGKLSRDGGTNDYGNLDGKIQDFKIYSGVAKYKGGFDVPKPYTPVGISTWRAVSDTCQNNFATLNPLASRATHTNGNLTAAPDNSVYYSAAISNFMVNSGKWYCEVRLDEMSNGTIPIGISELENGGFTDIYGGGSPKFFGKLIGTDIVAGIRIDSGVLGATDGSIARMWIDLDSSPISFSVQIDNNSPIKTYNSNDYSEDTIVYDKNNLIEGRTYGFVAADAQGSVTGIQFTFNFGQNPTFSGNTTAGTYTDSNGKGLFKYQPPSGFLALCEDNLPTPTIKDPGEYFKTVLYEGDNSAGRRINVGFQPDLIWFKSRNTAVSHVLCDSVRGFGHLNSNGNNVESTSGTLYLSGYADNGFDLNNGASSGGNTTGRTYVAWCWKAGGPTVTNTDGSIISQVSANQTAGFSIVSWTSTGSNDALQTVGHGLNTAPNMIILKNRDASVNWRVYHSGITSGGNSLTLNETEASYSFWPSVGNDTFGLANSTTTGQASGTGNQDIIAYCWAEIEGFSKFGSYVGNLDPDGPFVYCGFKPAWVMYKRSDSSSNWAIRDSSRESINPTVTSLYASTSDPDDPTGGAAYYLDFVSNGFKIRGNGSGINADGGTFIFAAFAESPFTTANAK
jgi:hypothetical protein